MILDDIAALLKLATRSDLPSFWTTIVDRVQLAAYQEIVGALINRGFTAAVIDTWDRGAEFEREIALYFACTSPQGVGSFDVNALKIYDRRPELKNVQVFVDGVPVAPTDGTNATEQIGYGTRDEGSGVFNFTEFTSGDFTPTTW